MTYLITLFLLAGTLFEPATVATDQQAGFWAWNQFNSSPIPLVNQNDWPRAQHDYFILRALETRGMTPSQSADARTLARRISFTLTGLPPSPSEARDFLNDSSDEQLRKYVDALLASPRYGEHWARFWLDLVRYTDQTATWLKSTGKAWLYRDWIVTALNQDMKYDDFVSRQLAADHLDDASPRDLAALGFLGLSPTYWKELRLAPDVIKTVVAEEWEERIDMVSRTLLGLTASCARCHDHKFDPITQEDYYALAGVFASTRLVDRAPLPPTMARNVESAHRKVETLNEQITKLKAATKKKDESLTEKINAIKTEIQKVRESTPHYDVNFVHAVNDESLVVLPDGDDKTKLVYEKSARDVELQKRGNPSDPGTPVSRRFLKFLAPESPQFTHGSGRRDLAEAVFRDAPELAARVIVNRVWTQHFGTGIVTTPSNFGTQGSRPTHPELLDDLAARFIANGWSLKWLHRELILSSTFLQSSNSNTSSTAVDPSNTMLWRMNRTYLTIEQWRDALLVVTGELDNSLGGPSMNIESKEHRRRTIYSTINRRDLSVTLQLHDFPAPTNHSPKRERTITPLQQLFALNNTFLIERADSLSTSLQPLAPRDQIQEIYRRLFMRPPSATELSAAEAFLEDSKHLTQFCHALLISNEFLFID